MILWKHKREDYNTLEVLRHNNCKGIRIGFGPSGSVISAACNDNILLLYAY